MIVDYSEDVTNIEVGDGTFVHMVHSHVPGENRPLVVIPPQFEKTARTNLTTTLFLLNNGLNVVRYDNRNHNGNSSGDIVDFTLTGAVEDIGHVMAHVATDPRIDAERVGILGVSIASRAVLEYLAATGASIDAFVSLVGVVNMERTLEAITGDDYVGAKRANPAVTLGCRKVINHVVDWDNFGSDLLASAMDSMSGTRRAIAALGTPTHLIVGEKDPWVAMEDVRDVFHDAPAVVNRYVLPGSGHELYKNPESAKTAIRTITQTFRQVWGLGIDPLVEPDMTEVVLQNAKERARERAHRTNRGARGETHPQPGK